MQSQEPLTVTVQPASLECWNEQSTVSALKALVVWLHSTRLSLRETTALEKFGVHWSYQTVVQWVHHFAKEVPDPPGTSAAGRHRRNCDYDWHGSILAVCCDRCRDEATAGCFRFTWHGTDLAAVFLGQLAEKHDLSETTFLVDGMGYLAALARCDLRGHLDYVDRNLIEKWFQTLSMRIDRFQQTWMGG